MYKIYLVIDPVTGRGLYKDEEQRLGVFDSLAQAEAELGALMSFCDIRTLA
jgi:hypothetical protein